jgi:hypothetical protein
VLPRFPLTKNIIEKFLWEKWVITGAATFKSKGKKCNYVLTLFFSLVSILFFIIHLSMLELFTFIL